MLIFISKNRKVAITVSNRKLIENVIIVQKFFWEHQCTFENLITGYATVTYYTF